MFIHAVAVIPALLNTLAWAYKLVIIVLILISLFFYLKQQINFQGLLIRSRPDSGWEISDTGDYFQAVEILPSTVLTSFLIVFCYKAQNNKKKTILICNDAVVTENYRRLMVELKITGLKKDAV